jgi:hypothetical protein
LIGVRAGLSTAIANEPLAAGLEDALSAYEDYLDSLEGRRSDEPLLSFEEFVARTQAPRPAQDASTMPAPPEDDDIPF